MDPRAWRRFRKNKGALVGAALVVVVTLVAGAGPLVTPYDPDLQLANGLQPETGMPTLPSAAHWLGCDQVGRDELSRMLVGGRVSLEVAFGATALAVLLGLVVGVLSGYIGGSFDLVSMRGVDVLLSLPFLLVAIVFNRVFDTPSLLGLYTLLGLLSWTAIARVVRAKTMQVVELEMVAAARALGIPPWRVVTRHVVPNVIQPAIILGTNLVAAMIVTESAMSFLGLGVRPPTASWGSMLHDAQGFLSNAPRLTFFPGALILLAVFGFNLLGEGLRDALDPKDGGPSGAVADGGQGRTLRSIRRVATIALVLLGLVAAVAAVPDAPLAPRFVGAGHSAPQHGGTFVFHHESDVRGFDPHTSYDELSYMGIKLLYDGLLDYDYDLRLVPRLAEAMPEVSPDGLEYTFHLRHHVLFHNGRELVAEDVRWSMEHLLAPATHSPGAPFFAAIDGEDAFHAGRTPHLVGVAVLDRYTVRFRLSHPDYTFLNSMAMVFANPVAHEMYSRWGADAPRHPIGVGPFELESWEPGVRVVFKRNRRYWQPGLPYVDREVFELSLQREAAFMRFRAGEIDAVHRMTPADRYFLRHSRAWRPYTEAKPDIDMWGITMNVEMPPFDNVHVRRAVAFAIDRERWSLARNHGIVPLDQAIPVGFIGHDDNLPERQRYDLPRAREEMRLAGYPNGLPQPVEMWMSEGPTGVLYGELAQNDLERIGIHTTLKQVSFPVYLTETGKPHTAQMLPTSGWIADFPDPSSFVDPLFTSASASNGDAENRGFYRNPEIDELAARAHREQNPAERERIFRRINSILTGDAVWAFAYSSQRLEAWQPYVHGYRIHLVWTECYRDVWLDLPRRRADRRLQAGLAPAAPLGVLGAH